MALTSRDLWIAGITTGICFFIFTSIGREALKTGVGVSKAEAERLLKKVEKRSKERAKI